MHCEDHCRVSSQGQGLLEGEPQSIILPSARTAAPTSVTFSPGHLLSEHKGKGGTGCVSGQACRDRCGGILAPYVALLQSQGAP